MSRKPAVVAEPHPTSRPKEKRSASRPRRRPLLALAGDDRLARRARGGDEAALEVIFRRYEQDLHRFCMGILGEPQDAQDALQNTMVKVLRALPGERREIKLKPWLYRIAHNEAVELRRRQRQDDALEAEIVAAGASLEDQVEGDERLRKLFADMADLPERRRAALIMRELNGLEFGDIAAALGTSPGAVRQALYEARRGLAEMQLGREMRCAEVSRILSDADGSTRGRRDLRAHLRDCAECRRFRAEIDARRQTLAAISPLPAVLAAALAKSALGGGGAGLGAVGALGSGAGGGAVATSVGGAGLAKSVAGVLAFVALGTAAADRSGLLHAGEGRPQNPGDRGAAVREAGEPTPLLLGAGGGAEAASRSRADRGVQRSRHAVAVGPQRRVASPGGLGKSPGAHVAGSTAAPQDIVAPAPPSGLAGHGAGVEDGNPRQPGQAGAGVGAGDEKTANAHHEHPEHPAHGEAVPAPEAEPPAGAEAVPPVAAEAEAPTSEPPAGALPELPVRPEWPEQPAQPAQPGQSAEPQAPSAGEAAPTGEAPATAGASEPAVGTVAPAPSAVGAAADSPPSEAEAQPQAPAPRGEDEVAATATGGF